VRLHALRSAAVLLTALAVALGACGDGATERITVIAGGLTIDAEVVRSAAGRAQGLGERDSLAADEGMLFVFDEERVVSFWMRGMRFPLDFIWISRDGRVVDLTGDVPPPAPGAPDAELPRYAPGAPVLYTLEVNAGVIDQAGVEVGDTVAFDPDVSPEDAR